jgi:hypothetical protein
MAIPARGSRASGAVPVTHHRTMTIDGVNIFDTGHIALEDRADEIVPLIHDFLDRRVARQ